MKTRSCALRCRHVRTEKRAFLFCCGMTARQGYERGFYVVFGSDVTATDDPRLQEAELQVLRKGFARVLSASEILDCLEVTAEA